MSFRRLTSLLALLLVICLGSTALAAAVVVKRGTNTTGSQAVKRTPTVRKTQTARPVQQTARKKTTTAASSRSTPTVRIGTLRQGSSGRHVMEVQAMLTALHCYSGDIDGSFRQSTTTAVKKFQRQVRLSANGQVDNNLYRIMSRKSGINFSRHKKVLTVEATAYTASDPGCSGFCANGMRFRKGMIAVDPRVIPMNSWVYVENYGIALAADTGGAIKGHIIDLAYHSRDAALQWGRRNTRVYIY